MSYFGIVLVDRDLSPTACDFMPDSLCPPPSQYRLTVLGFLAMVIFSIHHSGLLQPISHRINLDEMELVEYVENVHYALFSIMVFYVVQVVALIRFASKTEKQWCFMDKACRDEATVNKTEWVPTEQDLQALSDLQKASWYTRLIPQFLDRQAETIRDTIIFRALRREFILDRATEPPFLPSTSKERLDFDFGRYLAIAQSRTLAHIVEVEPEAWLCFALATMLYYAFGAAVQEDMAILSWFWAGTGWCVLLFNAVFERHLERLRSSFLPSRIASMLYDFDPRSQSEDERDWDFTLLEEQGGEGALPGWCNVDPDYYVESQRWWITQQLVGGKPNRQQTLFWMDRHGPQCYHLILQVNLIFTGVYAGLLILAFIPVILDQYSLTTLILYCLLSLIPIIGITYNKRRLVATLTQVCSIGSYRKLQIVNEVLRRQKTLEVVRTLIVIYNMRRLEQEETGRPPMNRDQSERSILSESERAEVHKTFDKFDADGSGEISHDELRELLSKMGLSISPETVDRILADLDEDGDGLITREEFLNWYSGIAGVNISVDDLAHKMFDAFDENKNGEITIGEFKDRLDTLSICAFTLDEIGAMLHELDRDHNGSISFEEFKTFLIHNMPDEMHG